MSAATLLANNVYRTLRPGATEAGVSVLAKSLVPVVALVAVYFTLQGGETIVALLLMGYSFVTQLFPSLVMSLLPRNPLSKAGALAGIIVGVATVAFITLTHNTIATLFPALPETLRDLNVGIVALVLNVAATVVVGALTWRVPSARQA
jgi:solute:Na+ symporter, SSS family